LGRQSVGYAVRRISPTLGIVMIENWLTAVGFMVPVIVATVVWFLNERSKRAAEAYERKEQKYSALIEALQGFYESIDLEQARQQKSAFLSELNKCWLYCPDSVILKVYAFLETVHTEAKFSDEVKEQALGVLMVAIRKDLLDRKVMTGTNLSATDFKHLKAT
jgi:ABC-type multidrug transport system fused ATPase/permease subunit